MSITRPTNVARATGVSEDKYRCEQCGEIFGAATENDAICPACGSDSVTKISE